MVAPFVDGFFHADPHQGNLFVLRDGRVCFLDFGAIGYLDEEMRDKVALFYMALIRQDAGQAARLLHGDKRRVRKDGRFAQPRVGS